jgi:4-hydroxy-tetrahydrodipicolinate synthase
MSRTVFTGVYVPLATPFGPDGEVNTAALERLIDWVIDNGASGLVPCGTTGESPTLSHEEHLGVIEMTVKFAAGRVPVIAGTGSNSTAEAVEMTIAADHAGADGFLMVTPYYNRPSQAGIIAHFEAAAASTDKPIILYNIPKRTGTNMDPATIIHLSKVPNITGIKEASGDIDQIMQVIQGTHEFSVLTGDDNLLFTLCALGGHGGICTSSHFLPGEWNRIVDLCKAQRLEEARALHYRMLPLAKAMFCEPNPAPLKAALQIVGIDCGDPRLPMTPAGPACREQLKSVLDMLAVQV